MPGRAPGRSLRCRHRGDPRAARPDGAVRLPPVSPRGLDGQAGEIKPLLHDFKDYELVLFGTPVWAGHMSSPVRTCLQQHKASLRRVAFFCTQGGSGAEKVLEEMTSISGKQLVTTLIVNDTEIKQAA